jgi:hypothetical protein
MMRKPIRPLQGPRLISMENASIASAEAVTVNRPNDRLFISFMAKYKRLRWAVRCTYTST